MGRTFQVYLDIGNNSGNGQVCSSVSGVDQLSPNGDCERTYACMHCRAHLAAHADLISKSFHGSQGRAYLFDRVVNVIVGPAEERLLLTGLHSVADIYCHGCRTVLGWKYERAFESSQRYKEGKYIIELAHLIKDNGWDSDDRKA
ncbi:hypothetical protein BOX15_Mlig025971g1 [Macrostomum lignano]|uniref:Protein yippee-like n=1 Tax=Macrostomum lignano TaxID=282301 RepID=A0A267DUH4_9PLAT|nr:hypothetical protein BOX15_Mlig025971g1 [Macrostomum lignano]